jgi:nicotinamide phosphoribosyltransferase
MQLFAPNVLDFYKVGHINQYPEGTTRVYSNFTARSGWHSNIKKGSSIIFVGLQYFIINHLIKNWNETFFSQPKEVVIAKYKRRVSLGLGFEVDVRHMEELHDLGYLPIEIRALPEGSRVPYGIPVFTIENTIDEFFWVTNMLETVASAEIWAITTAATTYNAYRKTFIKFAEETGGSVGLVPFQGHDFGYRGSMGMVAGAMTGLGALLAGAVGTDTIPAIDLAESFYFADADNELVGASVSATEHSVMCSGSQDGELDTYRRLINDIYPEGILSIVSDTWDFWQVVMEFLPILKDDIMKRNGKVVIRPDSGDPVKILTGYTDFEYNDVGYKANVTGVENPISKAERKGLIEVLWDIFGGTLVTPDNTHNFKVLDPHIGAIYGDSITLGRQEQILQRLKDKGFSSSNVVLGLGSYTYQYVTRDTHGFAMKATYIEVNGEGREIFKDPKTDSGTKKSAKGLLQVISYKDGAVLELKDQVNRATQRTGALVPVFRNGKLLVAQTLSDVRARVAKS